MSAPMKSENRSLLLRLRHDESGAVVVLVAAAIAAMIGLAALAVDIGNLVYAQRRLQAVTDMAALAGAEMINCSSSSTLCPNSAINAANAYSGKAGSKNVQKNLTITMATGYPQLKCLTSITTICTGSTAPNPNANAILVEEQAQVPFLLGQVFGFGTVTLTATSLASKGGRLPPMNIMIVLDNTASMNDQDGTGANCGGITNPTRIQCALAGVQSLLAELWPSQDQVGLIVFPPVSSSTAANDSNCSSSKTITPEPYGSYSGPSGSSVYVIAGLTSNYQSSGSLTTPGTTSTLVTATCQANSKVDVNGVSGSCGSCQGNKVKGGEGTYLADAITAAQSTLAANSETGVQNVIIVLSDGGAGNTSGSAVTSVATSSGGTTLTFPAGSLALATPPLVVNSAVCDTNLANNASCSGSSIFQANTTVTAITSTTVTLSNAVKRSVSSGETIYFGAYNQCNASILAARAAASAGTWVYSIAYGSYINAAPNSNSCSDTEASPIAKVSACATMQNIANSPGVTPDLTKFYSDPMNVTSAPNGPCTSPDNANATDITTIFENLGFQYTSLLPNNTN
jgi:Flp pilus assembly protein TadG